MLLQQQGGAMNVQLPQVASVQQTSALTSQVQQTTINPVHSGTQQLTIQQQAPPPQQSLQQQTNALTQVGHTHTYRTRPHTHLCSHYRYTFRLWKFRLEKNVLPAFCIICDCDSKKLFILMLIYLLYFNIF